MIKFKEPPGLGISRIWLFPDSHPFHEAAVLHDLAYSLQREGYIVLESSKKPDSIFLSMCFEKAKDNRFLRVQAVFFYSIARTYGKFFWPKKKENKRGAGYYIVGWWYYWREKGYSMPPCGDLEELFIKHYLLGGA